MTEAELRELLGNHDAIISDPFNAARHVANVCNIDPDSVVAREMVIRALENKNLYGNAAEILNVLTA